MAKQLNVNLAFTADTGRAKAQLQDLQNQLTRLMNVGVSNVGSFGITNSIVEASQAAATLKVNLQEATNVNTGKLDLGKFQQQMKQSGMSLQKYRDALLTLGPDGTQAFASLATSITQAEIPLRRSNALLTGMWTTLKNTARWQISSSILHGFMGTLQSAYGYAQDLNESLNNIRIVTNNNIDQMAKFAEQANKAAKALSTTTTEYTNASLIYYQQGLTDQEVQERTDVTIKMANAAGQSAEIVSDQMTAVWNNFDDGSKSLEYYADVMTALGAATASSTDEIADGLEKFAAVAETVGLSYEYATASLATITATTRQSADVVGNALKTLFARIQGLTLGETLDDGTNLNKYSDALNKVGISIFEQNGQMKEMDKILDEMGQKWDTLDKSQQTALAQTVAGVRQYTQLIALMDNWDFFQQNLDTVANSAGTLDQQAQIYAESWEAAEKRVKASAQAIYDALLDDEFFIDLTDFSADVLDTLKNTIDSLGGLKGTLLTISSIITVLFRDQIAKGLQNTIYNLRMMTETGRQSVQQIRNDANKVLIDSVTGLSTAGGQAQGKAYTEQANLQKVYIANAKSMDQVQQKIAQTLLDQQGIMVQNIALEGQELEKVEQKALLQERTVNGIIANTSDKIVAKGLTNVKNDLIETAKATGYLESLIPNLSNSFKKIDSTNVEKFRLAIQNLEKEAEDAGFDIRKAFGENTEQAFSNLLRCVKNSNVGINGLNKAFDKFISSAQNTGQINLDPLINALQAANVPAERAREIAQQLADTYYRLGFGTQELALKTNNLTEYTKRVSQSMVELSQKNYTAGQAITALAGTMSSVAMSITSIINLINTWNNEDLSGIEKMLATMTTLGLVIPTVTRTLSAENTAILALSSNSIRGALGLEKITIAEGKMTIGAKAASASLWTILWPILAISAAALALGVGIGHLIQKQNEHNIAAEKAKASSEELKGALQDATDAYEDLKNAITDYDEAQAAIDELRIGTDEYTEAVRKANEQVLDLIEKYPKLAAMVTNTEGRLQITDEGFDTILDEEGRNLNATRRASLTSQIYANQSQDKADIRNLALNSSWVEVIGESAQTKNASDSDVEKVIDVLLNPDIGSTIFSQDLAYFAEKVGIEDQNLAKALYDNKEELINLSNQLIENSLANELYAEQIAASYLADNNYDYQRATAEQQTVLAKVASKDVASQGQIDKQIQQGLIYNNEVLLNDKDVQKAYAELQGWDIDSIKNNNGFLGLGGNAGTGTYNFSDGTSRTIDDETARQALAQNMLLEQINSNMQHYADAMNGLNNISNDLGTKVLDFAAERDNFDINEITQEQYDAYRQARAENGENIDWFITEEQAKAIGFNNAQDYINAFDAALENWDPEIAADRERQKEQAEYDNLISSGANELEVTTAALDGYTKALQENYDGLKDNKKLAAESAIANGRFSKGVDELRETLEDNWDALKGWADGTEDFNDASLETFEAAGKVAEAVESMFGVKVDTKYVHDNLTELKALAEGNTEALDKLALAAAQNYIINLGLDETDTVAINSILDDIVNQDRNVEIGSSIDTTQSITELNKLLEAGTITAEQVQDAFGAIGYKPNLQFKEVKGDPTVTENVTDVYANVLGSERKVTTLRTVSTSTPFVSVPYIEGEEDGSGGSSGSSGGAFTKITNSSMRAGNLSADVLSGDKIGDSGGGKEKDNEGPPKTTVKRYKEIDDQLDNISKKMSKVNRESEQLYGAAKVSKMKENIQLMKKEVELLKQKEAEAEAYLALDKAALDKAAADAGIHFTYNDDGTIANYTEQMNIMQKRLEDAYAAAGSTISDSEQKLIDAIAKHIETLNDAISDYDDSLNTMEEQADAVLESLDNVMRENYSVLTYELELKLEIDEAALQEIEFAINQLSDDFYKMAEIASLMIDQIDPYSNQLETLGDHFTALTDAFEDGEIAQEDYIDGLKETRDSIYDQLNALVDLDKEMMEYYGNTLDAAMEELDKYTDHMEHLTGVIDHYISLMELMGKSTDFEAMDEFLSARAETTKNELDVAKSNYEMLARQKAQIEERMAGTKEGSADWKLYKNEWDKIVAQMDEAQDEMLSKTEEWMEAMKAVIENNMNKAAKSLEDALTNGMSFDHMMTELDRLNKRQEEYLTKTNQVYETNKLMRAAAQAADKTDNAVAKQKFKNFAEETKQLQEKGQLSKYELEIQQAKYDLLLAEIALEDAQNAKSTVRLQRDSEGNFGYVYTADQDKISEAQQAVEDAENDLYNISLNGQQEYTEKYTQALQSMYDEMKALQEAYLAGDIATEQEYQARKEALMQHYFGVPDGILTTYSNLYNIAVQTDANATADFWAKSYGDMTANTEAFKDAVNGYLVEVETETEVWHEITKTAQEDITEGLEDLVDESEEYADVVDDEVIPALEDELDAVEDLTAGYADQRDEVLRLIQTYKQLVQAINAAIAAAARQSGSSRSSSGDFSMDMINARESGDDDAYDTAQSGRVNKENSGNYTSVSTDRVDKVIDAAYDPSHPKHKEAKDLVDDIKAGDKKFTNDTVSAIGFGTGGYTGEWGPQAKLAFVHEKEIMLNPDDTVNFLSAIKITRSIMELIDKQAGWASAGLGIMSASGVQDYNQVLEQEVTIHAEFPNATDHNEIEEAFNNLMNTASQYANRKNR